MRGRKNFCLRFSSPAFNYYAQCARRGGGRRPGIRERGYSRPARCACGACIPARVATPLRPLARRGCGFFFYFFDGKTKQEVNLTNSQKVSIRLKCMYVNTYFKKNRWKKRMQLLHGTVYNSRLQKRWFQGELYDSYIRHSSNPSSTLPDTGWRFIKAVCTPETIHRPYTDFPPPHLSIIGYDSCPTDMIMIFSRILTHNDEWLR